MMILFKDVSKHYDTHSALRKISFFVEKGEMAFITGPSGSGKTTLLKLIYMAERPDEGEITVGDWEVEKIKDSNIASLRRNIGVVFQDFKLLHNRNVFENIALSLRIRGITDERDIKGHVFDALKTVNLRHKADNFPNTLSGGEQQRIAIARAIVSEPMIILADEPTGNVDPDTSTGIIRTLKEINTKGTTIILATHNRELFRNTGRRVLKLDFGNFSGEEIG